MPIPVELPVSKAFSQDRIRNIEKYCDDRLSGLVQQLKQLREDKITQWRRIYMGMPREKVKSFPWQNASNLVVQLVGSYTDQLKAKFLMSIFGIDPLFEVDIVGEWDRKEHAQEQRDAVQGRLGYVALEPSKLNLLPKYSAWASTIIRYGMGAMKIIPQTTLEKVAVSGSNGRVTFDSYVKHDGPVALPLIFEDFLIPLTVAELERSPFTAQRCRLNEFDMQAMLHDSTYDKVAVKKAMATPDRVGPERSTQAIEQDQGVSTSSGDPQAKEWDVFECWFPYSAAGHTFQLIWTYHLGTKSTLKSVFNWLPNNELPFVKGVLGYDGERSYGFGFAEMLKDYQEEVSAIHNRRGDASTLSNTNIFRIGGGLQTDSQFSVFPNAIFSGEDGAIEVVPLGRQANETIKDEQMTLQLATDRAGVGPSSSGMGSGTVTKKGIYSAMGTYAVMQEGDTRTNLNKTEFKQAHYLLGRKVMMYEAWFGIPESDSESMGKQAKFLLEAYQNVKKRRLALPIRAATGSINKEIEKQNLMLLLNNVRSHYQMVAGMMQAIENPMLSPSQRDYFLQTVVAGNMLMMKICKDFGINDPSSVIPEPAGLQTDADMAHQQVMQQKAQQITQQIMQMMQQQRQQQPPQLGAGQTPPPEGQVQ